MPGRAANARAVGGSGTPSTFGSGASAPAAGSGATSTTTGRWFSAAAAAAAAGGRGRKLTLSRGVSAAAVAPSATCGRQAVAHGAVSFVPMAKPPRSSKARALTRIPPRLSAANSSRPASTVAKCWASRGGNRPAESTTLDLFDTPLPMNDLTRILDRVQQGDLRPRLKFGTISRFELELGNE